MLEPNETYARIQSVRVRNLEQQVNIMHRELQRIRDGILPKKDLMRLSSLMERLNELNCILIDLRKYFSYTQQYELKRGHSVYDQETKYQKEQIVQNITQSEKRKQDIQQNFENDIFTIKNNKEGEYLMHENFLNYHPRESAGYEQKETDDESKQQESNTKETENNDANHLDGIKSEPKAQFKSCKQLMDEIKSPGSILGNYLLRLQDFRTDPELRRQRWERKQQEKLQQLQKQKYNNEFLKDKQTLTESLPQFSNTSNSIEKLNSSSTQAKSSKVQAKREELKVNEISDNQATMQNNETDSILALDLPLIRTNLSDIVYEIVGDISQDSIVLTIVLENDHLYHISVSLISSGHSLSCFLATEEAVQEAKLGHLFSDFLTFFIVNADNSQSQKDRILGHSFEFMNMAV